MLSALVALAACGKDGDPADPPIDPGPPLQLTVLGTANTPDRVTAEVAALGNIVYTTTWGCRGLKCGDAVKIWDAAGAAPVLIDSLIVERASTLGDVQISDDGKLLVVAAEPYPNGSIELFDLTNPRKPVRLSRVQTNQTIGGVHTVKLSRVNNRHYAFLSIDPSPVGKARLTTVDITDPRNPLQVHSAEMGNPFVHDVFVRAGLLFTALWHDGLTIWDIGGGGAGGTPSAPVQLGNVKTLGGHVHNVNWFHDPKTGAKKYAFVGQEGAFDTRSRGDIHVVDISNLRAPKEVALFTIPGAGVHNFALDEPSGILYAAYYSAGVRAFDIRGDLGDCTAAQKFNDTVCDFGLMKRERGRALTDRSVSIWGVAVSGNALYASDMVNGLHKIDITPLKRN